MYAGVNLGSRPMHLLSIRSDSIVLLDFLQKKNEDRHEYPATRQNYEGTYAKTNSKSVVGRSALIIEHIYI